MIKPRIDVDYLHPSRSRNLIYVVLGTKNKWRLKRPMIIAKMINEPAENVKAY